MQPTTQLVPVPQIDPRLVRLTDIVLDGLSSPNSKTAYRKALSDFFKWFGVHAAGESFSKAVAQRFVAHMEEQGLSAATINQRLAAVRRLAIEAADNGLMEAGLAQAISRVKGKKKLGVRSGNWLTREQAEALLHLPDISTLKGKRDRAILAVMIGCGLRRAEVSALTVDHLQQRDGRWIIVDMAGKGGRIRTVPVPSWAKVAVDDWKEAVGLNAGILFRSMNNKGKLSRDVLLPQNIMELVVRYGEQIGVKIAPHDLRRTFAKLAHKGHAAIEQIQLSLGHASIQTTERYLGVRQDLHDAPCDRLGINIAN